MKPDILDHHVLSFFEPIRPYFNRITDRFYFQNNIIEILKFTSMSLLLAF